MTRTATRTTSTATAVSTPAPRLYVAATGGTLVGHHPMTRRPTTRSAAPASRPTTAPATSRSSPRPTGRTRCCLRQAPTRVSVSAFGYFGAIDPGVSIATDATTTHDVNLAQLPRFTVSGTITSAESGVPLPDVSRAGRRHARRSGHQQRGRHYSLVLPIGTFTLSASADGCTETGTAEIVSAGDDVNQPFALFRKLDDFGHACSPIAPRLGGRAWPDRAARRRRRGPPADCPSRSRSTASPTRRLYLSSNGNRELPRSRRIDSTSSRRRSLRRPTPNAAIYPFWAGPRSSTTTPRASITASSATPRTARSSSNTTHPGPRLDRDARRRGQALGERHHRSPLRQQPGQPR